MVHGPDMQERFEYTLSSWDCAATHVNMIKSGVRVLRYGTVPREKHATDFAARKWQNGGEKGWVFPLANETTAKFSRNALEAEILPPLRLVRQSGAAREDFLRSRRPDHPPTSHHNLQPQDPDDSLLIIVLDPPADGTMICTQPEGKTLTCSFCSLSCFSSGIRASLSTVLVSTLMQHAN